MADERDIQATDASFLRRILNATTTPDRLLLAQFALTAALLTIVLVALAFAAPAGHSGP